MKIFMCDNGLEQFVNFRCSVAAYFHKCGYDVSVIVPATTCTSIYIQKLPDYINLVQVKMNRNGTNPFSDWNYYKQLSKLFQKEHPDIVFTYTIKPNIYGTIAAKKIGIPVVSMVAGLGYCFNGNSILHKFGRWLYRYGLSKADRVIVLNESNLEVLRDNNFVEPRNLILFEGGEGVDMKQYPLVYDEYKSIRFLMVARVLYDKGYSEYVEAAKIVQKKYPGIQFDLIGSLDEESPMGVPEAIVAADVASGAINFKGHTDNVPHYVGKEGVVVVLISSYLEGLNRSLMEACAMGRICITSNISGCKEIVEDGVNGFLVEPKSSRQLADAMIRIIESPIAQRQEMAKNSFNKAKRIFDVKYTYDRYKMIIEQLVTNC